MKVKREELSNVLTRLRGAVADRDIIPLYTHFKFSKDSITATDLDIGASVQFETGLDCLVPAGKFQKLISSLPQDEVELVQEENELTVKAKGHKSTIATLAGDFPSIGAGDVKWEKVSEGFVDMLKMCLPGASRDMTMPKLCGVYVEGRDVVSTNNYIVYNGTLSKKVPCDVLFPTALVEEMVKWGQPEGMFVGKSSEGSEEEDVIYLKYFDGQLIGRMYTGDKFPAGWRDLFPENDIELQKLPVKGLKDALVRIGDFSELDKNYATTTVSFNDGKVRLVYKGEVSEIEETMEVAGLDGIEFGVNPYFLASVLNGEFVRVGYTGSTLYVEGNNLRCIVAVSKVEKGEGSE